jgi:protein-arginine kinase activator protein McsA
MTKLEQLNTQLKEAVEKENYEKAAQLRDEIAKLQMRG